MDALAEAIESVLPCLRRYACALMGSMQSGDRYVEVCLEAILHDATRLDPRQNIRLGLFELFHEVISVFEPVLVEKVGDALPSNTMKRRIVEMPLQMREALLLAHLADFSHNQISEILDISVDEVSANIAAAREMLATRRAVGILVIEDEAMTAIDLAAIVHHSGHTLLGVAATHAEALRLAHKRRPDLILADVKLGMSESGVATASEIAGGRSLPVIFITGHVKSLLDQHSKPQFIIAKPFRSETVEETITEALGGWMLPSKSAARTLAV
jgi:DNA-directed RNA polymerase specialized sigma24 family protein